MKHLQLVLMALAVFALALGCDDDDSGGDSGGDNGGDNGNGNGEGDPGELGWALDIAKGESEYDDLVLLWGTDVRTDGTIGEEGTWVFFFTDLGSKQEARQVVVFADGSTNTELWSAEDMEGLESATSTLPEYRDASPWIVAADAAVPGLDFSYRTLTANPSRDDEYPGTDNRCMVQYLGPNYGLRGLVLLDADTMTVLDSMTVDD